MFAISFMLLSRVVRVGDCFLGMVLFVVCVCLFLSPCFLVCTFCCCDLGAGIGAGPNNGACVFIMDTFPDPTTLVFFCVRCLSAGATPSQSLTLSRNA